MESTEHTLRGQFLGISFALFLAWRFNSKNDHLILCYSPKFRREEVICPSADSLPHQTIEPTPPPKPWRKGVPWVGQIQFRERGEQSLFMLQYLGKHMAEMKEKEDSDTLPSGNIQGQGWETESPQGWGPHVCPQQGASAGVGHRPETQGTEKGVRAARGKASL